MYLDYPPESQGVKARVNFEDVDELRVFAEYAPLLSMEFLHGLVVDLQTLPGSPYQYKKEDFPISRNVSHRALGGILGNITSAFGSEVAMADTHNFATKRVARVISRYFISVHNHSVSA